jgi:hypothetical protein
MKRTKLATIFALMVLFVAGCATHRTALPEKEAVSLEYAPKYSVVLSPGTSVTIFRAEAYQKEQGFVVSGKVRRPHEIKLPGHVDLSVCSPDGTTLAQETTRVPGLNSNRSGVMELPFRFRLDFVPPEGAKVRLNYHAPSFKDGNHLSCT